MRLLENSSTKNIFSTLNEDFWNPCEYFTIIQGFDIDMDKWNNASQEERDAMVRPQLEKFWKQYGKEIIDKGMLEVLFDDLEDSNFHTEYRILRDIVDKDSMKQLEEGSLINLNDPNFKDTLDRDFRIFIEGRYDIKTNEELEEKMKNITEEDINAYFTDMFYDIVDEEDLDSSNAGEEYIRDKYLSSREEVSFDEIERMMSDATTYDELYDAAALIQNPDIRANAEDMLDRCKRDGDDVDVAYSVTTTEYVDPYRNEVNIFDESVKTIKESEETLKESDDEEDDMDYYDKGIYKDIEETLIDAGFNVDRFTDAGVLTNNIGWEVSNENGHTQLSCLGSFYDPKYDKNSDEYEGSDEDEDLDESAKTLKEGGQIWSNTATEDYYSNLTREEMIQEIKDNGWDEEEINGKPILDADDEELRDFLTPQDIDLDYEDYENSIEPMIEKQVYGDYIVLCGIAANWRGKGEACKAIKLDELKNYLMPNYDAHIKLMCDDQDNLYYTEANHDTPMGGTEMYLYGFLDETAYDNAEKEMQRMYKDDSFDMYYFCDWLGYSDAEELIKSGLLKNIKRDPQYVGLTESKDLKVGDTITFYSNGYKEDGKFSNKKDILMTSKVTKVLPNGAVSCTDPQGVKSFDYISKDEILTVNGEKLEEAKKPKKKKKENKEDKRVIMQQGNVTCFKENDSTYYVFENESDNEVEYNNQEDAMQDFMERVGVNPEAELAEE